MGKTPEYTKNAIKAYQAGKDRVNLLLDYGTKDRIKERYGDNISITAYIKGLIEKDLNGSGSAAPDQLPEHEEQTQDRPEDLPPFM